MVVIEVEAWRKEKPNSFPLSLSLFSSPFSSFSFLSLFVCLIDFLLFGLVWGFVRGRECRMLQELHYPCSLSLLMSVKSR